MSKTLITNLIFLLFTLATSCSSWSPWQKRVATTIGSAVGCGIAAKYIADKNNQDAFKSSRDSALLCGGIGDVAAEKFFPDGVNKKIEKGEIELSKYRQMDRNQGLYYFDPEDPLANGPDRVKCPTTNKDVKVFCTTKSDSELSDCEPDDTGYLYLNSKWAVQFQAWYSPGGCYPGPYAPKPELKRYFNRFERQMRKQ